MGLLQNLPFYFTNLSRKVMQCSNRAERIEAIACDKEDLTNGLRRKKLAVFVSGGGSNFRSIHEACLGVSIHGDIVALVTSKQVLLHSMYNCKVADYARDTGFPVLVFPKTKLEPDGISSADLVGALRRIDTSLSQIHTEHPSLTLQAFGGKGNYGMKVHKAVIASGARYTGPTIHFVDEHFGTGRILAHRVAPLLVKDTAEELAARVLQEEHRLYLEVITALCERIIWREDGVPIIRSKENPNKCS